MKKILLTLLILFNSVFVFSQDIYKRIAINNPSSTLQQQISDKGIDLSCGVKHDHGKLILELSEFELKLLDDNGISYNVVIEDLTKFYKDRIDNTYDEAVRNLESSKLITASSKTGSKSSTTSKSISSTTLDNFLEYVGCDEINWTTPTNFNLGSMGGCLTVSEMEAELDQMRSLYPGLVSEKADASSTGITTWGNPSSSITNNGQTYSGQGTGASSRWDPKTVYYVRITGNQANPEGTKPQSLFTSMIHAREVGSLMSNIYFMWYLLENYATNDAIKNLVDNNELYFIPVVNPDGLRWNEHLSSSGGGMQRKNCRPNTGSTSNTTSARGVDLNRNFDYFWGTAGSGSSGTASSDSYRGPNAFSEPETQILKEFVESRDFKTCLMNHTSANAIPHPYGGNPTFTSGREDEMHKWHEDMTRYNRYVSGATIFTPANGIADDWMVGGTADANGKTGSTKTVLASTPEHGGTGFWPPTTDIEPIAKRAMRISLTTAYYAGKYAKLHDLTQSDINTLISNLTFGIERLGQTTSGFALTITPISSNITSIATIPTQTSMSILEQRNVTAQIVLNGSIAANDKIEYNVQLSDGTNVFYNVNFEKYYQPTILLSDNPDSDLLTNWTTSGTWTASNTTGVQYSGSRAIKLGNNAISSYGNNTTSTLTLASTYDLSSASETIIQFYTKWDLERNYDFVELLGSTNGSSWQSLCGKYNKPSSTSGTNGHDLKGGSASFQSNNSSGQVYDGDRMDKWVMEEVVIDASNNSFLNGATNAQFRFRFRSDGGNVSEAYSTTSDGFFIDDFKITSIQIPCTTTIPTNLVANSITTISAIASWDNIPSATYDLRYRETSSGTWIDVLGLSTTSHNLTSLTASTNYEVQVRNKCGASNSAYSASVNFTTTNIQLNYCDSSGDTAYQTGISRVVFGAIDKTDGPAKNVGYEDFTSLNTTVTQSSTEDLTVYVNTDGNYRVDAFAWIDWNQNGVFTDSGETYDLGNISNVSNGALPTLSISVPASAQIGSTRMRVSGRYNSNPTSCQTNFDGEVEDYTVTVQSFADTTVPVITLTGPSTINLNVGDTYTEQGATAADNIDGDITGNIVTTGTVNTSVGGAYLVNYNVSDAAGNAAVQVVRTVNVIPDTTVPVITLAGAATINLNVGDTYTEQGATAADNIDGDITGNIVTTGTVNTSVGGAYLVNYNVSDAAGNAAVQVVRTVNVIPDTTAPVITLVGASTINLNVGDAYTEQGATAADDKDGNITASIITTGTVNTSVAGAYLVNYNVSDAAGNAAVQVTRTINVIPDTTAPVITLVGASTINLNVGDTYAEQGAIASDDKDGDVTASIITTGTVNTSVAGAYLVNYNVSDAAGNAAVQVTRTINVIPDTTAPVITLVGSSTINLNVGDAYIEQGATASDDKDGNITASIITTGTVNTSVAGTYLVNYNVSDATGNAATQVTRTVNVIPDTIAPVITLVGASTINLNVGDVYTEQGATASDDKDGDITASIVTAGDTVNTNTAGAYVVTYNVSDAAGNPATEVTRTVNVIPDTTSPVITLVGASTIDLNVGDTYAEQGAIASDDKDGDITASIVTTGTVNTSVAGAYLVNYNVSDAAGNAAVQVTRTINVIPDTTVPVIALTGSSIMNLNVGDVYTEQGATATDDKDGDITASLVVGGDTVNTNTAGAYVVTYNVSDAAGNAATEVIRTVNVIPDTTVPVITLVGSSTINLNVGDAYTEQGATATDDIDGNLTSSIVTTGTVNTGVAGTYTVNYNVSDAAGNAATQLTRTVNITQVPNGCTGGISSFPYTEGFENTLGAWTQSSSDDIDWTVDANGTPSNNTGPSSASQGSYYVFVEASTPNFPSKRAILNSPCFDLSGLSAATFSFKYHMFGAADMGTIALEISTDEGSTWTSIWSQSGNKGNSWQTANVDVSAYIGGGIQLRFNRFVGSTWQADIAIDDVSMIEGGVVVTACSGGITSFPYTEGFENTLGAWTQSSSDDINWTIDANGTPSNNTGPASATQGSYYIFVEASGNGAGFPNKQAIINSPCYDLSGQSSATFSFGYHMYGDADMGTIALEASNDNGISWTSIWSASGNKGNSWQTANVNLSSYVGNSVQLRFNRITGSTWKADIALDNINLTTTSALAKNNLKNKLLDVDTNLANTFLLYPNPVKGDVLNIKLSKGTNMSYRIINMLGQVVNTGKTTQEVMVNNLEAGMYYIEVNDGNATMTQKFIKSN